MSDKKTQQDLDFENFTQARLNKNYGGSSFSDTATKERLKDVNKKLPSWNLEPPYDFIK